MTPPRNSPKVPPWVVDTLLVAVALTQAALEAHLFDVDNDSDLLSLMAGLVAAGALILRRRQPYLAFALTVPGFLLSEAEFAALVALYSMARYTTKAAPLVAGTIIVFVGYAALWDSDWEADTVLTDSLYGAMFALAPLVLGLLARTREDLSARIAEAERAREVERELIAQRVLTQERARLAREMHDVVSHQVSLIAVQAGALQMVGPDPDTRQAARTIRELSVATLDELRHMVGVLRAADGRATELHPQPGLRDLEQLVAAGGIPTSVSIDPGLEVAPPLQRAVYRTVQEALTNVRKHAPGASVSVSIQRHANELVTAICNTAGSLQVAQLPSHHQGLIGLRERAELLGGTVTAGPTPAGGFFLELRLPIG